MANINLSWNDPMSKGDIDNICVHRFDTDQSATYADGSLDATEAAAFAAATSTIVNVSDATYTYNTAGGAKTFADSVTNGGTYTYGVFSKNGAGYGPGEAVTISV
jgi:hypothetical protein